MKLLHFTAWATMPSGAVRRLEIQARHQAEALCYAFAIVPQATAISARADSPEPLRDALLLLDRRTA